MVKGASTQSLVKSFLAILRMDGDMATFFVSMLTEQGVLRFGNEGVLVSQELLVADGWFWINLFFPSDILFLHN
ncbi:hypothetical protein U1Q18_002530 [Sarracenia purpurea var. burkii]